jgi:hypothetical protein
VVLQRSAGSIYGSIYAAGLSTAPVVVVVVVVLLLLLLQGWTHSEACLMGRQC